MLYQTSHSSVPFFVVSHRRLLKLFRLNSSLSTFPITSPIVSQTFDCSTTMGISPMSLRSTSLDVGIILTSSHIFSPLFLLYAPSFDRSPSTRLSIHGPTVDFHFPCTATISHYHSSSRLPSTSIPRKPSRAVPSCLLSPFCHAEHTTSQSLTETSPRWSSTARIRSISKNSQNVISISITSYLAILTRVSSSAIIGTVL